MKNQENKKREREKRGKAKNLTTFPRPTKREKKDEGKKEEKKNKKLEGGYVEERKKRTFSKHIPRNPTKFLRHQFQ